MQPQKRPRSPGTTPTKAKKQKTTVSTKFVPLARQPNTVRGGPEKKNIDSIQNLTAPIAGTGQISQLLTTISQGTTSAQRIGRKTKLMKLVLNWQYSLTGTSVGGSPLRIKVVYDKQTNGAAPVATDILSADEFQSPNNLDNSDRFITIVDEITEPISVQNNFSVGGKIVRSLDLEQIWQGATASGAVTGLLTGSVYMFIWQTGSITVSAPTFDYYARIRFEDN